MTVDDVDPNRRTLIVGSAAVALNLPVPGRSPATSRLFTELALRSVPVDTVEIETDGYRRSGIGGARYRATSQTGQTAFRSRVADGRWFELCEPVPDITMFGAMVDNHGDDTMAWSAAIEFAIERGVDLTMPAGNSKVSRLALLIPAGGTLRIRGAGKWRSAIIPTDTNDASLVRVEAVDIDVAFALSDLAIVDPLSRQTGVGLSIARCARFRLHDVRIAGWRTGLELLGAIACEATDVSLVDNAIGRRLGRSVPASGGALYSNLIAFTGGDIRGNHIGTLIEHGNQVTDRRIDVEGNGIAGNTGTGAIVIEATMGEELASRGRRDDGPCQYIAEGCWFEQNKGQAFVAHGVAAANIVLDRCTFVANEGGRDIAISGVGGVSLLDTMCVSPDSTVSLNARMERVEGGLYAGTLHSSSAAASHRTRVAALDRAGWMTSHRLWHRDAADSDLAWFTDKDATGGSDKDSTAWKYGDGRVRFRHGAADGRASLTLAPDAIGFLDASPKPRQRIALSLHSIEDAAARSVIRELIAALEAFGLVEHVAD